MIMHIIHVTLFFFWQEAGQTYVVSKRPMKGHGREMIQLGLPIADAPFEDEVTGGTFKGMYTLFTKKSLSLKSKEIYLYQVLPVIDIKLCFTERRTEPIPSLFQDVIERLMETQILSVKPDSCIIDIYNEVNKESTYIAWYNRLVLLNLIWFN